MSKPSKSGALHLAASFLSTFFTVAVVLIALLLIGARALGVHMFNVESGSMEPVYPMNSLVFVKAEDPASIREGDVITYVLNEQGALATHRVIAVDTAAETFTTKGDANNVADALPVRWDNVVGKVVMGVPSVGPVVAALTAEDNRPVMIAVIAALLLLSVFFAVWERRGKRNRAGHSAVSSTGLPGKEPDRASVRAAGSKQPSYTVHAWDADWDSPTSGERDAAPPSARAWDGDWDSPTSGEQDADTSSARAWDGDSDSPTSREQDAAPPSARAWDADSEGGPSLNPYRVPMPSPAGEPAPMRESVAVRRAGPEGKSVWNRGLGAEKKPLPGRAKADKDNRDRK